MGLASVPFEDQATKAPRDQWTKGPGEKELISIKKETISSPLLPWFHDPLGHFWTPIPNIVKQMPRTMACELMVDSHAHVVLCEQ